MPRKSSIQLLKGFRSRREYGHEHWLRFLRAEMAADCQRRGEPRGLDENEVLLWADGYFSRQGSWPTAESGPIPEAPGETWLLLAAALALGIRGFPRGRSLAAFLDEHGRRNSAAAEPRFTIDDVLGWADAWRRRTGEWPTAAAGEIPGSGGVSWGIVDDALRAGRGAMPGGSSLGRLLVLERLVDVRPPLCEEQILEWADAHHTRTGRWPKPLSVAILEAPDETWSAVSWALNKGRRGLPGGSSLPRLLLARRQVRSRANAPPLEIPQILEWADAFRARIKRWPTPLSGPIQEAPGETWSSVSNALIKGQRGLPGGSTIAKLLVEQRGMKNSWHAPRLSVRQILRWADAFFTQTGEWPTATSGAVPGEPGETWSAIQVALRMGHRGLPGGSSLFRLLALHRGRRDPSRFFGARAAALSRKSRRIASRSAIEQRVDPRIQALLEQESGQGKSEGGRKPAAGPPDVGGAQ
jgi:hypothetical protein